MDVKLSHGFGFLGILLLISIVITDPAGDIGRGALVLPGASWLASLMAGSLEDGNDAETDS